MGTHILHKNDLRNKASSSSFGYYHRWPYWAFTVTGGSRVEHMWLIFSFVRILDYFGDVEGGNGPRNGGDTCGRDWLYRT